MPRPGRCTRPGPPSAPARPTPALPSARAPWHGSARVLVAGQAGGELSRHAQLVAVASTTPGGGSRVPVYSAGTGLLRPLLLLHHHAQPRAAPPPSPDRHPSVPTPSVSGMVGVGHGKDTAPASPCGCATDPGPCCAACPALPAHRTATTFLSALGARFGFCYTSPLGIFRKGSIKTKNQERDFLVFSCDSFNLPLHSHPHLVFHQ